MDGAQQIVISGVCDASVPVHRVCTDVQARRRRRLPVPATRRSRSLCPHRFVPSVAHACSDDGQLSDARPSWRAAHSDAATALRIRVIRSGAFHRCSTASSGNCAERYRSLLLLALGSPRIFIAGFFACVVISFGLWPFLGRNFFPAVDSGQILMHVRAQPGTRIEETARLFDLIEQTVRQTIPPDQLTNIVDNIGLPFSGINMAYQNTGTIGPEDGDALISLKEDHELHRKLHQTAADPVAAKVSGNDIFVLASRHCLANSQFRFAGANRRAGYWQRSEEQLRLCH